MIQPNAYKKRRRWRPKLLLLAIVLGVGAYFLFFHHSSKDITAKRPQAPVTVAAATRKDVPVYLSGLGTISAYNTVTVRTQVDGQLIAVRFREGQDVKAGDVLAQIDPRTFQAQYDQAVATKAKDAALLANAQLDLKRYSNLGDSVSRQVLDTQRATVKQLEATLLADQAAINNVKTQLGYTTITSPIGGRTGIRQVDMGNIVHPGDANGIVVVTQVSPISVIFSLPQQNLEAINTQLAQHKLGIDAMASDNSTVLDSGVLELVDNQIDQTTGTIRLKATLPNSKHLLWPGGFTNVRLLLTMRNGALTVPTVAVQHGPQGAYVFAFHPADNTVAVVPVTVGMTVGADTVIDQGLDDGAQVITDGMAKLQDGSKVALAADKPAVAATPAAATDNTPKPAKKQHHKRGS